MDKAKAALAVNIVDELLPIASKFIELTGDAPVREALMWLSSLIAVESGMPVEDFIASAKKCYLFNKSNPMPGSDKEQLH